MLVRQHAVELARHGNTVNGVAPTVVRTQMGSHWLTNPVTREQVLERIPLGRVAGPQDVVASVLFFCGSGVTFFSGQTLYVDGGFTATQQAAPSVDCLSAATRARVPSAAAPARPATAACGG
jgi:gluconate 5-dehydrogenase